MPEEGDINWKGPAREITKGVLQGVWDWWRGRSKELPAPADPTRGVLILGPGGTGKTTFARLLSGDLDWLYEVPGKYVESSELERYALSDDADVEVVVAPGQHYRRAATWPELLKQVAAGEYRGVVLLNAYGYHTFSTPSYQNHQLYAGSKPDFLKAYYADRRADEIRVLQQLVPHLSVCAKKVWLLLVVAKQDLWGSQQKDVEDHYLRGEYAAAIQEVSRSLGDQSFRHEPVFLSLIIRNLETLNGERLQTNEAGYDMRRLVEALRTMITIVAGLKTWEDEV